jgi:hypothetical protein
MNLFRCMETLQPGDGKRKMTRMNRQPQRPAYADFRTMLRSHEGLIVHFSTSPPMHAHPDGHYPSDLHTALTSECCRNGGISCSVVTPSDPFSGDTPFVPGYIGIILDPQSSQSIVSCSTADGGDVRDLESCTVMGELQDIDLSIDDLERTITERNAYNNWLVKDYGILGVLALPPFRVERIIHYEHIGPVRGPMHTNMSKVAAEFPRLSIYTVSQGQYFAFRDGSLVDIKYADIWPCDNISRASE